MNTQDYAAMRQELESYRGRTGMLRLNETPGKSGGNVHVKVRVREARLVFSTKVDLLVEPVFGLGQTWIRYRDTSDPEYTSRLTLEE